MSKFNVKRISCPVHGSIGLSQIELDIIQTSAFQRLRNVKQLGLAYYVFPGADYSRFSHSLGVCHVTGRILEALKDIGTDIPDTELQRYRLAALCHDIGHYPFSHATEEAVENYYKSQLFAPTGADTAPGPLPVASDVEPFYKHEALGKEILRRDPDIGEVLKRNRITDEEISSVFFRSDATATYANLVSSDLDADRIDYLLRTARHTGLPYGSVDLDYLLSQITLDAAKRVCITEKALRTADHFLLCRYFDYQQVAFHKTVAALELVLKDVLQALLETGLLDCSGNAIVNKIQGRDWAYMDDVYGMGLIRDLERQADLDDVTRIKARSILQRNPPKLLVQKEIITERSRESKSNFLGQVQHVKNNIAKWAGEFDIAEGLWYPWHKSVSLTKMGSRLPVSTFEEGTTEAERDKYEQSIRVVCADKQRSRPISELNYSLMNVLSNQEVYSLRLYVLLTPEKEGLRKSITDRIKADLNFIDWKD